MTTALYPGSFDPVTNGHLDIALRAASLFDKLFIGVYSSPSKEVLFTTPERVEMWQQAVSHLANVQVETYNGLTVDFARIVKARVIVRGLRMSSDFENEFEMALMNRKLAPELDVICLMSNLEYQFLSSSLLKEVTRLGGSIDNLVPPHVAVALKAKFSTSV